MKSSKTEGRSAGLQLATCCLSLTGWAVCLHHCSQPLGWCKPASCQLTSKERWWFEWAEGLLLLKVGFQHHREMLNPPPSPPSAPGNKCLISFIGWFGYGENPAHILAPWMFAEDWAIQIMLAKSREGKRERKGEVKPSLISSFPVCATCFQTELKPSIFSAHIACDVFEACEKVRCWVTATLLLFLFKSWPEPWNLSGPRQFIWTGCIFPWLLEFSFSHILFCLIPVNYNPQIFACLHADLTETMSVHFS